VYYELSYGWVGIAVPGILWLVGAAVLMFVPQVPKRLQPCATALCCTRRPLLGISRVPRFLDLAPVLPRT